MTANPTSWSLVGRGDELARIALARAEGRAGVVISGSAGVGKSRLAREALSAAERDGAVIGWVQGTRSAASVPLGAFASLLPADVRSDDLFELMQRSIHALLDRAHGRPFVLGVDDAQWLDPTSATLVLQLTTTGAALVLATVRSDETPPDAIVSLWKDAGALRLELKLLSETESETLVEQIADGPVERGARRWVSETSRGGGAEALAHQQPYVVLAEAWAAHAQGDPPRAQKLLLAAAAQLAPSPVHAARLTYEAMRASMTARRLVETLQGLRARCDARLVAAYADHTAARAADDGAALLTVADEMEQIGALRYATEAAAHAADAFARHGRQDSARRAAARSRQLHSRGHGGPPPTMDELNTTAVALTRRETQLVKLASQGLSNAQIADHLVLSVRTVESHLYRAMQKLGVNDRHEL